MCQGPLLGGRSGAALYAAQADHVEPLVVRVTTLKRATREMYALQNVPSARSLWPTMGPRLIHPLPVTRGFEVAATVTRRLRGARPPYSPDMCTRFPELFEGAQQRDSHSCPPTVVKLHLWLLDVLPGYATAIRHSLVLGLRQEWDSAVAHGDPSLGNLIVDRSDGIVPIDFASGGLVARRLHRARWSHAVHCRADGEVMDCDACPTSDPIAFITDAARRLRSDAADPQRSARWRTRIIQLLETLA